MKFIRLATVAALSTTIFAGGVQVFAEETDPESKEVRKTTTTGQVTFTPNIEDTVVEPDPEGPEVTIPPIPGTGPLTIATVPTMNFGTKVISTADEHYNMIAEMQQKAGTTGEENMIPYVSMAQVQDTRGTNEGWELSVSLSEFQTETDTLNRVLKGAQITLFDPSLRYSVNDADQEPTIHASGLELIPNEDAVPIMTAANRKGGGTSSIVWGDHDALAKQVEDGVDVVENKAIQLFVPGSTAKDAVTYTSTLTWELELTPDNEAPDEV